MLKTSFYIAILMAVSNYTTAEETTAECKKLRNFWWIEIFVSKEMELFEGFNK